MSERIYDPLSVSEQDDLFNQMGKWLRDNQTLPPREFLTCEIENLYRMRATIYQMRATIRAGDTAIAQLEQEVLSLRVGSAACDQAADDDEEVIDKLEAENKRLLERVRELERCHKTMSEEVAKYIVLAGKGKNEVAKLEEELRQKRRASIVTPQIEALEAENKRLLERVRELERLGLFDERSAAIESRKRADAAESQLAAANERITGLEQLFNEQAAQHKEATLAAVERIAALEARILEAKALLRRHLELAETAKTVVPNRHEAIVAACEVTDDTHRFLEGG